MTLGIEVSAADFGHMNKGLITVLKAVQKAGSEGISTRKLLYDEIKMIGYGQTLVKRAEREGYIKRKEVVQSGHKGAHLVINCLTPKGKKLLSQLNHANNNNTKKLRTRHAHNVNLINLKRAYKQQLNLGRQLFSIN